MPRESSWLESIGEGVLFEAERGSPMVRWVVVVGSADSAPVFDGSVVAR